MCGINGLAWRDEELMSRMNRCLAHRGPDDEGVFADAMVTLGNRRLAIIDLSSQGHQPMQYGDLVITYNGEVYNYRELRDELILLGYKFGSNSDTEVILAAYKAWGSSCVRRFEGMWAFCIYDRGAGKLFLSRDRFGIKPLYYMLTPGRRLVFSSEIRGILQAGVERRPNDEMIFDFLYWGNVDHTEETFFKGILRLLPAQNMLYSLPDGKLELEKYYDPGEEHRSFSGPSELRSAFAQSISRHLVSDVPVGSCLSGGIDSSAIVCEMRRQAPSAELKTFSLTLPDHPMDESKWQKLVISRTRPDSHSVSLNAQEVLEDLRDLVVTQEEPFQTLSIYGQYRVMKLAHESSMKVLLDGQGADELLGGYHTYFAYTRPLSPRSLFLRLPMFLQSWIRRRRRRYISKEFYSANRKRASRKSPRNLQEALKETLTTYSLPALLRFEDKNSMRWSIETRVPYLDRNFVEVCMSVPADLKIRGTTTKFILRKAFSGLVPDEILQRSDKIGFQTPDEEILESPEFRRFLDELFGSERFRSRRYWDWRKVGALRGPELWPVVLLELWLREFIDALSDTKKVLLERVKQPE
jgi:asparagine synthase (glutamine-hydrolysing)